MRHVDNAKEHFETQKMLLLVGGAKNKTLTKFGRLLGPVRKCDWADQGRKSELFCGGW